MEDAVSLRRLISTEVQLHTTDYTATSFKPQYYRNTVQFAATDIGMTKNSLCRKSSNTSRLETEYTCTHTQIMLSTLSIVPRTSHLLQ